jgi:hypothetical protein
MLTFLSVVTSIKDYVEVIHKLIETDANFHLTTYYDFGSILTFLILSTKNIFTNILTFHWFERFWSIPTLIPDISSALISEIFVFDGIFHNNQNFFENPIAYGNQNFFLLSSEKFMIGFFNSLFLCFPTSIAHIITLRRFVMQGLEAGFISGLGTICGNLLWIGSILFGFRFLVIPWLSLDLFRYFLGFLLIVKYMWDSYSERRLILEDLSKYKIFFLTFLLSFTEQTTIYPFLTNISFGSDATILETFPTENISQFFFLHSCYLLGLFVGSFSLLQFMCWFWENPAFQIYMWVLSSFKTTTTVSSKFVNLAFLYLTMICAISNLAYFGFDYTLTNPLGFVHEDRLLEQKELFETSFLNTKASDRNTRRNRGRHGRRERWKRRVRRYRTFDASLYDQGVYDLLTFEDLNYGFDRFWLRRKIRNHRVRFRFFPGPWMRSFKKQLSRPRLESFMGPRVEFFRILFEQAYHPEFHEFSTKKNMVQNRQNIFETQNIQNAKSLEKKMPTKIFRSQPSIYWNVASSEKKKIQNQNSTVRKFLRKVENRVKIAKIQNELKNAEQTQIAIQNTENITKPFTLKGWTSFSPFEKQSQEILENPNSPIFQKSKENFFLQRFYEKLFQQNSEQFSSKKLLVAKEIGNSSPEINQSLGLKQPFFDKHLLKKQRFLERYKTFLANSSRNDEKRSSKTNLQLLDNESQFRALTLFHPLKFYFQTNQAFKRKVQFYGVKLFRNFGVENNAPYFRVMMKKFFYHYKPSLRWERTLRVATMRRARRKSSRIPKKFNVSKTSQLVANSSFQNDSLNTSKNGQILAKENSIITKPTHFYSLVDKRATRYRYQIYKDVLQHWYYSPLNRFLLKLDVDSFIRRQPNSYFLTKEDEKFLHLKRQLLSEYSETLRWYTYMQHYSTMKNQIGGTKSLATRAYNQQFVGTFKKIRHLFNITPSFDQSSVLKFDQPLYNEYENSKENSIFFDSLLHEELRKDEIFSTFEEQPNQIGSKDTSAYLFPQDLTNQSKTILREYLKQATPLRQQYIEKLLHEKNYWDLTKFLFRGQKTRGTSPVINQTEFLNQEKDYLLQETFPTKLMLFQKKDELWVKLLKKCQKKLYDQEALKQYVALKKEKYENQKQKHEKYLQKRLTRMKESFYFQNFNPSEKDFDKLFHNYLKEFQEFSGSPSAVKKALTESLLWEKNSSATGMNDSKMNIEKFFLNKANLEKTNIRNNRKNFYSFFEENNPLFQKVMFERQDEDNIHRKKIQAKLIKQHLQSSVKGKALEILETEKTFKKNFQKEARLNFENSVFQFLQMPIQGFQNFLWSTSRGYFEAKPENINNKTNFISNKLKKVFSFFVGRSSNINSQKNLDFWKKRENALAKRKKIRKTLKRLRNQTVQNEKILFENTDFLVTLPEKNLQKPNRQKRDFNISKFFEKEEENRSESWKKYLSFDPESALLLSGTDKIKTNDWQNPFRKKFQRKRSRFRRYSSFKGRGPIKKRTLREKLKRQFKSLKRYGAINQDGERNLSEEKKRALQTEREKKKMDLIEFITQRNYKPEGNFLRREHKQRRTRQIKHRVWKKKKQNFAQKRRKLRKRRRSTLAKIRVYNKKLHRILAKKELQRWWWKNFIPTFQELTEKEWQNEKNLQIQRQLGELSEKEILERDKDFLKMSPDKTFEVLQIGDKDYKPFAIPQALRIRENLIKNDILKFSGMEDAMKKVEFSTKISPTSEKTISERKNENLFNKLTKEFATIEPKNLSISSTSSNFFVSTNPIPFYAGWDDSLRKFVITNRLLSRQDSFTYSKKSQEEFFPSLTFHEMEKTQEFEKAPLQGMNAATTLYWQIPFTTYDPDQFFALGMDGFSPLGWRNFSFKHSKETTKPILVKNLLTFQENSDSFAFFQKSPQTDFQVKLFKTLFKERKFSSQQTEIGKNFEYRRMLKKQKRIKKHPRPPVWFPSGSLSQQVLPVHYIYVFYKRSRLPRDRYIRRRLRSTFVNNSQSSGIFSKLSDFTLRKRIKPRRKYHRKRFLLETNQFVFRRRKFRKFFEGTETSRPSSTFFQSGKTQEKRVLSAKQRRKSLDSKQSSENIRVRQLRRRVQRQVFRPVWRYRPRAGGFVWPGDYLRLESIKAPELNQVEFPTVPEEAQKAENTGRKIRKKKRQTLQEWQLQPKKYLFEKHNLKVLKKRIEKSGSLNPPSTFEEKNG